MSIYRTRPIFKIWITSLNPHFYGGINYGFYPDRNTKTPFIFFLIHTVVSKYIGRSLNNFVMHWAQLSHQPT